MPSSWYNTWECLLYISKIIFCMYALDITNSYVTNQKQNVKHDIGPTMDIARGLVSQSTIEYPSFLEASNWLQNSSFQKI